jgi:O-antigen/teichoic acid export membrane protein
MRIQAELDQLFVRLMQRLRFGIGERTWTFFHGLSSNALASSISRVLCGLATLMATRWLGPTRFGEANLALAIALWIQVPFMGIPLALMHHVPRATPEERDAWAATGVSLLLGLAGVTLVIGYHSRVYFSNLAGIPLSTFLWALAWCTGFAVHNATTALLVAYERFQARANIQLAFGLLFPLFIAYFWIENRLSASHYILALTLAYGLSGVVGLWIAWPRHWFHTGTMERLKPLLSYGLIATMASIQNALFNAPGKLIGNQILPLSTIGVLSAYQAASGQLALFLLGPATQVLFPIASRTPDRQALFKKIMKGLFVGGPIFIALTGVLTALYIWVLSKGYPLSISNVLIFSISGYLNISFGLISWGYLASEGRRGLLVSIIFGCLSGLLNTYACQVLIPRWGMLGAGFAFGIGSFLGIVLCVTYIHGTYRPLIFKNVD